MLRKLETFLDGETLSVMTTFSVDVVRDQKEYAAGSRRDSIHSINIHKETSPTPPVSEASV